MSWRRIMYNLMYRFGAPRWDTSITPPEVVAVIEGVAAFDRAHDLDLLGLQYRASLSLARWRAARLRGHSSPL